MWYSINILQLQIAHRAEKMLIIGQIIMNTIIKNRKHKITIITIITIIGIKIQADKNKIINKVNQY